MKNKKILILSMCVLLIIVVGIILFNKDDTSKDKSDALKFKEEYESLNGTVRESDKAAYNDVSIDEDNPIVYVDINETLQILENKKGIIYIGANWCPWCRTAVEVMLDVANDLDIEKIYYLNLDDDKSNFKIEDKKLVEVNHGSKYYYKLLEALDENLNDYVLTDEEGTKYETGEKRIYMPYVFTVKNGKVQKSHLSTVNLDEGQTKYDSLTKKQYKELYNIYYEMFDELYNASKTCSSKENCD